MKLFTRKHWDGSWVAGIRREGVTTYGYGKTEADAVADVKLKVAGSTNLTIT